MNRVVMLAVSCLALGAACGGCSRAVSEGMGVARGASGKVVSSDQIPSLISYKSLQVAPIGVAPDLHVPADMPAMIRTELLAAAAARGLAPQGEPALRLAGQIIHYETAGIVDTAIGPLAEVIVRTSLIDAQSGKVVAEGNLVGRSKATMSSSPKDLSEGVAKALDKWLKDGGLSKAGEKND